MVTPEIRRLQVLNDLIAQTLDVINQRSLWASGLSHTPYAAELGVPQLNPFLAQYGVPQTTIGQLAGAQVPFATPGAQVPFAIPGVQVPFATLGLMHTPFAGLGQQAGLGLGFGQPGLGVQVPFGQQPIGQFYQATPYAMPLTPGLMHTPFTGYPVQRGFEGGIGFGQPGVGFVQQPLGPIAPQIAPQAVPTTFPWAPMGFGAGRYGQYF